MVAHAFDPNIHETEAIVWGQNGLQSKFQASQGYITSVALSQR